MTLNRLPRLSRRLAGAAGLSLAEITVILSVASVLGATLTPAVGDYVTDARMTKAEDDVRVLANALARLTFDVDLERGDGPVVVDLMVGPGSVPGVGGGGDAAWARSATGDEVVSLDDHLVTNAAGHQGRQTSGLLRRGWRGPYLCTPIGSDPWGRRYAVNVGSRPDTGHAVVVLSAGPNGLIETPFAALVPTPGGDDVVAMVTQGGL